MNTHNFIRFLNNVQGGEKNSNVNMRDYEILASVWLLRKRRKLKKKKYIKVKNSNLAFF